MEIRKINFDSIPYLESVSTEFICIAKFFGARMFRICNLPDNEHKEEIAKVLNTVSIFKNGVWYIKNDAVEDIVDILILMGQDPIIIQPDIVSLN